MSTGSVQLTGISNSQLRIRHKRHSSDVAHVMMQYNFITLHGKNGRANSNDAGQKKTSKKTPSAEFLAWPD